MKKKIELIAGVIIFGIICVLSTIVVTTQLSKKKHNFTITQYEESVENTRYKFLGKELSDYICELCLEMDVDPDLVVAHLMVENPEFDVNAIHRNENGTVDCGLFQLNDRYLWTTFKNRYWFEDVELDPFNWKCNTYIAIHHIQYLQNKLKVSDDVIAAYNCGDGAVMSGNIPAYTFVYRARVKNNIWLLKNREGVNANN